MPKTKTMGYRINDRNIGGSKLDGSPKKRSQKLTADEIQTIYKVISNVYDAMKQDDIVGDAIFTDGGRITLSLTGEQMYDLFEAKRKLNA